MDVVNIVKVGYFGLFFGMVEVGYVLWCYVMKFNFKNFNWFNCDCFVFSVGYGCFL